MRLLEWLLDTALHAVQWLRLRLFSMRMRKLVKAMPTQPEADPTAEWHPLEIVVLGGEMPPQIVIGFPMVRIFTAFPWNEEERC